MPWGAGIEEGVQLTARPHICDQARSMSSPGGGYRGVSDEDRKCFVGNLNWKTSSDDLHDFFKQWGQIQDARVIMDRDNPFRSSTFHRVAF